MPKQPNPILNPLDPSQPPPKGEEFCIFVLPLQGGVRGGLSLRDLLQAMNSVRVLDDLDGVGLLGALGDKLELGICAKVLEFLARSPTHVHGLDVGGREVLCGDGAFAGQFYVEVAEVAQADLVASKQLLSDTCDCIGQDALHGTLGEGRVVVGDVLTEVVEGETLVDLSCSVGLGLGDVGLQRPGLSAHNGDRIVDHNVAPSRPPPQG